MESAQRSLWHAVSVLVIIGLALFIGSGGPKPVVCAPAAAATEIRMYLWIDGIEGECTDDLHKHCMEVLSYKVKNEIHSECLAPAVK